MSTNSANRKRAQKHQNKTAWKSDKFKTDPKTKLVQSIVVSNCCSKCTSVIQWKIDYGKYKPLNQPGKCSRCSEKRIKSAYHTICTPCVEKLEICAKCGAKDEVVNVPMSEEAAHRILLEIQKEVKHLSERRRRAFQRNLEKQEKVAGKPKPVKEGQEESSANLEYFPSLLETRKLALDNLKQLVEESKTSKDFDFDEDFDDLDLEDV